MTPEKFRSSLLDLVRTWFFILLIWLIIVRFNSQMDSIFWISIDNDNRASMGAVLRAEQGFYNENKRYTKDLLREFRITMNEYYKTETKINKELFLIKRIPINKYAKIDLPVRPELDRSYSGATYYQQKDKQFNTIMCFTSNLDIDYPLVKGNKLVCPPGVKEIR